MTDTLSPSDNASTLEQATTGSHPPLNTDLTIREFSETDYDELVDEFDMHRLHVECYRLVANEVVTGSKYPDAKPV